MGKFRISLKPSAAKEIRSISRKRDKQRVVARINGLSNDPRPPGCAKVTDSDSYRIRQGDYRIIYNVADTDLVVYVLKVCHRKDVY